MYSSCCSTTTFVGAAGRKSVSMARFIRSGGHFLKPEGALKRSDELLQVGQKNAALQTLHDVITSKRYRTWQKVHWLQPALLKCGAAAVKA